VGFAQGAGIKLLGVSSQFNLNSKSVGGRKVVPPLVMERVKIKSKAVIAVLAAIGKL
jgi:hypothetical protein